MSFEKVIGQDKVVKLLQTQLRKGQLSHAYLISGPAGTGKRMLALTLAKALFCKHEQDDACGSCESCMLIANGNYPFLYHVEPDGQSIKIDQIRELQNRFAYKTDETKLAIINQADRMTVQAANSLLKFLEEPISSSIVVLTAENGQALLPTIRSRVQQLHLQPLAASAMEQALVEQGCKAELARAAVRVTSGTEAALALAREEWFAEIRNLVIQLARESRKGSSEALVSLHKSWSKMQLSEHLDSLLDLFVIWYRDLVQVCSGNEERLVFQDQKNWLKQQAQLCSISHWVSCMEYAVEAKKRLRYNVNPQLTLEQFLIRVQGE